MEYQNNLEMKNSKIVLVGELKWRPTAMNMIVFLPSLVMIVPYNEQTDGSLYGHI